MIVALAMPPPSHIVVGLHLRGPNCACDLTPLAQHPSYSKANVYSSINDRETPGIDRIQQDGGQSKAVAYQRVIRCNRNRQDWPSGKSVARRFRPARPTSETPGKSSTPPHAQ